MLNNVFTITILEYIKRIMYYLYAYRLHTTLFFNTFFLYYTKCVFLYTLFWITFVDQNTCRIGYLSSNPALEYLTNTTIVYNPKQWVCVEVLSSINFWNWRWHKHPKSILMLGLFDPMNPRRERASQSTRKSAQISDPNPLDLELYSPWTHGRVDPVQESSYLLFPLTVFPS